jgi:pimeloyl-ACP methyl ester carboxylesterase
MERNPLRPEDRYGGPARFIVGGKSNYVEAADAATIRAHFPAAEMLVIPEAGHNPHMEARAAFVAAVLGGAATRREESAGAARA